MDQKITVGLAGNPNCGKTTIFNNITGTRQHVANYPGVTVDIKEADFTHNGRKITLVDLPGTYSLTAYSEEEMVTRRFILNEKPDVIVDILDASNLERNLYLAIQLLELNAPLLLVFNMADVAAKRGIKFNLEKLSRLLGVRIVEAVGNKNQGTTEILDAIMATAGDLRPDHSQHLNYGRELEEEISKIEKLHKAQFPEDDPLLARWRAIKLLEDDSDIKDRFHSDDLARKVRQSTRHLESVFKDTPEIVFADRRYGFISGVCSEAVTVTVERRHDISDKIDLVLINKALGLPIFMILMYVVFQLTFTLGAYPMDWLESFFGWLGETISSWWAPGSESFLRSLLVDGVIGGVGGVIVFFPNIFLLFMAIAILEDTGYMARAAFIMDSLMHKIGLHGKSFIPMLIGFGCSVPGIMATRTIESRKDRLTTMLILPLMSCGARLPIYALIIPAFFRPALHGPMLWTIYLLGIVVAIISAKLLKTTVLKGEANPFIMELPPYRIPTLRGILIHTWDRGKEYVKKAGTIILGISIILWALSTFPVKKDFSADYEARRAAARSTFEQQQVTLSVRTGLPPETLTKATLESSPAEAPEQARELVRMIAALQMIQTDLQQALAKNDLEPADPEYTLLQAAADNRRKTLRTAHPALFSAADFYIDQMDTPLHKTLAAIDAAQQSEIMAYTVSGRIGRVLGYVLKPIGFDWRIGTALIGALAAKEVFVSQLGIVFSVGDNSEGTAHLREQLSSTYSPLVGFCIMVFCLLSTPCVATIAVTRKESGSWKWAAFQAVALSLIAYIVTAIFYWSGTLLGIGV